MFIDWLRKVSFLSHSVEILENNSQGFTLWCVVWFVLSFVVVITSCLFTIFLTSLQVLAECGKTFGSVILIIVHQPAITVVLNMMISMISFSRMTMILNPHGQLIRTLFRPRIHYQPLLWLLTAPAGTLLLEVRNFSQALPLQPILCVY